MGLPYVTDPAITRHLAAFLKRHLQGPGGGAPDAILFNGGVFQPAALQERLLDVMRHWYDTPGQPWQPLALTNPSLDLAVAIGAAHYAWLKHTGGRRIGGGIARSYYIAVESGPDEDRGSRMEDRGSKENRQGATATSSGDPRSSILDPRSSVTVVCVVPQHLEEGQ